MKHPIFAAILLLVATSGVWAEGPFKKNASTPPGPALMVSSDSAGGLFAPGDLASYRVLNASPSVALGPIKASVSGGQGFIVVSNGCSPGLEPGRSCVVLVRWNASVTSAPISTAQLLISSQSPSIEVQNALSGNRSLSTR